MKNFLKFKIKMSYKFFTDASYSPIHKIGVISIDIYIDNELTHSLDRRYENVKNSELEKIGINICIEFIKMFKIRNYTIFSDCHSSNENIVYLKGHSKKSLKSDDELLFQLVDKRSRKIMRELVKLK